MKSNPLLRPAKRRAGSTRASRGVARRGATVTALATLALATGVACGDSAAEPGETPSTSASTAATVSIDQRFGAVTVPVKPARIVVSEGPWLDALLALGVTPVAYIGNGQDEDGLNAWERPGIGQAVKLNAADPNSDLPVEQVAQHKPDLILATPYVGRDKAKIDKLNTIAPTISLASTGDLGDGWETQVTTLGTILGMPDKAKQVIGDVAGKIDSVKAAHPRLAGKTALLVQVSLAEGTMSVVSTKDDPANAFFARLGMTVPEDVTKQAATLGRAPISLEQIDLIDADYLMVYSHGSTADELTKRIPRFGKLKAVTSGALTVADTETVLSLYAPGPLSTSWAIDKITPTLAKAAG